MEIGDSPVQDSLVAVGFPIQDWLELEDLLIEEVEAFLALVEMEVLDFPAQVNLVVEGLEEKMEGEFLRQEDLSRMEVEVIVVEGVLTDSSMAVD